MTLILGRCKKEVVNIHLERGQSRPYVFLALLYIWNFSARAMLKSAMSFSKQLFTLPPGGVVFAYGWVTQSHIPSIPGDLPDIHQPQGCKVSYLTDKKIFKKKMLFRKLFMYNRPNLKH